MYWMPNPSHKHILVLLRPAGCPRASIALISLSYKSFPDPSPDLTPSSSNSGTSAATTNTEMSNRDQIKLMYESDPYGLNSGVSFDLYDDLQLGLMDMQPQFEKKNEDGQANKGSGSPDMSWDAMFGPNAGLDKDATNWDKDENGKSVFEGVTFFDEWRDF